MVQLGITGDVHAVPSSPPAPWAGDDRPGRRHTVHFYEQGVFPAASVASYLWAGLQAGETAIVVVLPEHGRAVCEALANRGAPVDELSGRGRLVVRDARRTLEAFMVQGAPDPARFAACAGQLIDAGVAAAPSGSVRIYGECVAVLADAGNPAASLTLERLCNELLAKRAFSLYCAYPIQHFAAGSRTECFHHICDQHDEVVPVLTSLDTPAHHARCIAVLQQQARALELEIEERSRSEVRLAEALHQLGEADRRKNEFLAMLGHELRNPLAPITTALELMELRGDPRCERERAVIRRQAAHLKRLVDDLLDLARITRGRVDLHREPLEIATVVAKAIELASPAIERHAHRLSVDVPRAGLAVNGDATRLCQIFANLLCNAATYTNPGGHLAVRARRAGEEIVISVADDGCGIRPELRGAIFDLFVQGDRALDRAQGGLGLGLALVKIFTEAHGGTVSVESGGAGLGSTFTVRLPAVRSAAAGASPAAHAAPIASAKRRGPRVLIVDDNEDATELLAETLGSAGYETMVAYDGPEALRVVAATPPDVALIDIGLPVMDGYELAARLREARPASALRLIALTGYGQERDRERSRTVGFDIHLVKPVDLETLLHAIEP